MTELPAELRPPLVELLLSAADDKFILGHRNADWTGLAPILEEDIAFSSLAQDDLAHAAALYDFICGLTGDNANRLAYGRRPAEYRCAALVELADEFDWAVAIARQFLCDHFEMLRLGRLARSAYPPLAELARRMLAEERLSLGHADQWVIRLGRAADDAPARMQAALDRLAPLAVELFEPTAGMDALESAGVYPHDAPSMYDLWEASVRNIVQEAGLRIDLRPPPPDFRGGRSGKRSPLFADLLAELTEVYRVEPEAAW
ncbi:MAG: phenylacetate-CoA oxygenase subunit PaaC [Phycisphaerae bacterium]|nr:phenylacetate-CoA oxygenase subunit PaaC [Phycisphaerae bacterium]MCZ2399890.1 phenylacetate-CoA oxygenase subunit PaaC [Phycisphaerae bacterium]NUQ49238.1 phenylacetate-CoA oxygenase subunit PaaC [Phycisphaerae bacterium]